MTELDRLKEAFDAERTPPRAGARDAAVNAALAAFDANIRVQRQGSGLVDRLRIAARAASEILTGKRPMTQISMRHALAGGVSLAVLTLAVMTAANLQTIEGFQWRETREPIGVPPVQHPADADKPDALRRTDTTAPATTEAKVEGQGNEARDALTSQVATAEPVPPPEESAAGRLRMNEVDESAAASLATPESAQELAEASPAGPPLVDMSASVEQFAAAPLVASRDASGSMIALEPMPQPGYHDQGRDQFETIETNPLKVTAEEPVSTFSIDVDTSSYSFMRASFNNGLLPQDDSVRVEELINYFPYAYPAPDSAEEPFHATVTVMPTPWNAGTKLVHIGIKGYDIAMAERPHANLVFLIDTSGSMDEPNKLPLLINSMKLLVDELKPDDSVSIVVYAGSAGTVLEPTKASQKGTILSALENLAAGGSTAGAEGIRQAYQLAKQNFDANGVNRVILATDGDFNVGITDVDELEGFVERERESGVFLSVLGFGQGNYNDQLMQTLAQNGNGAAAYIDTLSEARKVLVEESTSTLFPIAKDVKLQVEFNPVTVSEYRLIGYETRLLNREDFNNDRIDAGEIGSGHAVTAIYEITPAGSASELVDNLRYGENAAPASAGTADEYGFLKIRYKLPEEDTSKLIETPISGANDVGAAGGGTIASEARFATSVAAFGQILRGGRYTGDFDYDDVISLANANKGGDEFGYRAEFVNLVRLAKSAASMEQLQRQ
jgi:Ca-activated chloride channel family protein